MKQCTKCKEDKELSNFRSRKGKPHADSWCKQCHYADGKARYVHKPKKEVVVHSEFRTMIEAKKRMLKHRYDISYETYLSMYTGKCDICKKEAELGGANGLFVDHNHKTGKVRGLLCRNCNTGIGTLQESLATLQEAINYLKKYDY